MCAKCDDVIPEDQYIAVIETVDGLFHFQPVQAFDRGDDRMKAEHRRNAGAYAGIVRRQGFITTCGDRPRAYSAADVLGPVVMWLARDVYSSWPGAIFDGQVFDRQVSMPEAVRVMIPREGTDGTAA
jgi:hypothetical protein